MKEPRSIIQKLLLTEKGTGLTEKQNQYLFKVDPVANKIEIKNAVEKIFNVKVDRVNTMNRRGKHKRLRTMNYGMTSSWKRAVVTLKEGFKIELT
ncbi:MAG TPA: 50S ribosomal protein L23 [Kiritimatiellia bacterium]|nr:50S ribosomal protein L23 [Kiritimatiellia bacterium]